MAGLIAIEQKTEMTAEKMNEIISWLSHSPDAEQICLLE